MTPSSAANLDVRNAGELSPEPEVVDLLRDYLSIAFADLPIAERDEQRRSMLAPGWMYHGVDGSPVDFDGLTERQTRNRLRIHERRSHDHRLFQYDQTAIFTFKVRVRGEDKGQEFEVCNSWLTVCTRTPDGWRVAADIVGAEPDAHEEPPDAFSWM